MKYIRIIPRLDVKGPNVVKPIHTEALRVVGVPAILARKYYQAGADELLYMDIVASLYGRNIDLDLVKAVADEIFIPLTVGGGIRTLADISYALKAGADKVAINTHAIKNPELLTDAVNKFGSQCIVLSIEAKKKVGGEWEAYTDGGREKSGRNVVSWIKEGLSRGVGEIILTSIDNDGLKKGFDLELVKTVSGIAPVPIVAHGGAGNAESVKEVIESGVDAAAISSLFHFDKFTLCDLKNKLAASGIPVRL